VTWSTHAVPALFPRPPATPPKSFHGLVDGHKKAPREVHAPGSLQVVASSLWALLSGRPIFVGGWGSSPGWAHYIECRHHFTQHNVAPRRRGLVMREEGASTTKAEIGV
jgi:hypothetical protein